MTRKIDVWFDCEFQIKTMDRPVDIVTNALGIKPHRFFNKGDITIVKHTGSEISKQWGLWVISTKEYKNKLPTLSEHINVLIKLLKNKESEILNLKRQYGFEVSLWVTIETEYSVLAYDMSQIQLSFLNKLCDWIAFRVRSGHASN